MKTCSSCNSNLLEHGAYCPSCGIQARCKVCCELLDSGVRFCVHCGTTVGEGQTEIEGNNKRVNGSTFNVIQVDRDNKSSHFRASVTDHAIDSLSKPLSLYLAGQSPFAPKQNESRRQTEALYQPLLAGLDQGDADDNASIVPSETNGRKLLPSVNASDMESERLNELFRERDGRLRLDEPQLKASGKLDYAQRLTYLFLYAREKAGDLSVQRQELRTILEDSKVYDAHSSNWIKREPALVRDEENIYLNSEGRRSARKSLEDVFDSERKEGWLPGESTGTRASQLPGESAKQIKKSAEGKKGRPSQVTTEFVPKWKALGLVTNGYSLIKSRNQTEQCLFALWAIRRATGDTAKIISAKVLSNFLYQAFEIVINPRTIENALKTEAKKKEKKVLHIEGTKFQITPDGIEIAERIAGVKKAAAKR